MDIATKDGGSLGDEGIAGIGYSGFSSAFYGLF